MPLPPARLQTAPTPRPTPAAASGPRGEAIPAAPVPVIKHAAATPVLYVKETFVPPTLQFNVNVVLSFDSSVEEMEQRVPLLPVPPLLDPPEPPAKFRMRYSIRRHRGRCFLLQLTSLQPAQALSLAILQPMVCPSRRHARRCAAPIRGSNNHSMTRRRSWMTAASRVMPDLSGAVSP